MNQKSHKRLHARHRLLAVVVLGLVGLGIIRANADVVHVPVESRDLGPTTSNMLVSSGGQVTNTTAHGITFTSNHGALTLNRNAAFFVPASVRSLVVPIEYGT